MRKLLIVETRDAVDHNGPAGMAMLAQSMASNDVPTTIFLTENGAFSARRGEPTALDEALLQGVEVLVDRTAMLERAISAEELRDGVSVGEVDLLVDHLISGSRMLWR